MLAKRKCSKCESSQANLLLFAFKFDAVAVMVIAGAAAVATAAFKLPKDISAPYIHPLCSMLKLMHIYNYTYNANSEHSED